MSQTCAAPDRPVCRRGTIERQPRKARSSCRGREEAAPFSGWWVERKIACHGTDGHRGEAAGSRRPNTSQKATGAARCFNRYKATDRSHGRHSAESRSGGEKMREGGRGREQGGLLDVCIRARNRSRTSLA